MSPCNNNTQDNDVLVSNLVTASNYSNIILWNLSTVDQFTCMPRILWKSSKELHALGTFMMDVESREGRGDYCIVTRSKYKIISLSTTSSIQNGCSSHGPV